MVKTPTSSPERGRDKILQAALEIFAAKGFSGASMSQIAKTAAVPQSLIYHYFDSKDDLWHQVKKDVLDRYSQENPPQNMQDLNLDTFIPDFVKWRFNFYLHNPLVLRIMNWQRLETNQDKLSSNSQITSSYLAIALEKLQEIGKIRSDFSPEMLATWINGAITAPLFDHYHLFIDDQEFSTAYLKMIIDSILRTLQPLK
jgi:AcrR family transcriptional regulator